MFQGSIVAMVTPFRHGEIDEAAFRRLIKFHLSNETDAILISGCTGEAANISLEELRRMIGWAKEEMGSASRKTPLLAGTGTNSTRSTLERTKIAESEGVDGVLLITPYYNKPTPEGQIAHFRGVAENTSLPVILYNVPGRTGTNMLPETVAELAKTRNIVALKEAGGNLDQVSKLRTLSDITILSGDDTLTLPMLALGATGVISVTANVAPLQVSRMCACWRSGDVIGAQLLHSKLFDLTKSLFIESNPMPVKAALELMGMISGDLRLPLVPVRPESRNFIRQTLIQSGLIQES